MTVSLDPDRIIIDIDQIQLLDNDDDDVDPDRIVIDIDRVRSPGRPPGEAIDNDDGPCWARTGSLSISTRSGPQGSHR